MLEAVNVVVYGLLAVVAVLFWRRRRNESSAWLAATFVTLGIVVVQGLLVPEADPADLPLEQFSPREIYTDVLIIVLLGFPYLLHRFTRSLRSRRLVQDRLADLFMVAIAVSTVVLPGFPAPDDLHGGWVAYQLAFIGWWALLLGGVAVALWRYGRGRPGVIRNRMRLMSAAATFMGVALVIAVVPTDEAGREALQWVTTGLGWLSAASFLLAFEPPAILRQLWRTKEDTKLRKAETGLVSATTMREAATAVVDAAAALVGGDQAEVRGPGGTPLARSRVRDGGASPGNGTPTDQVSVAQGGVEIVVYRTPLSPVFGEGETLLLEQLCGHLALAMRRIEAFEESQRSLAAAEKANTDLSQLVYGVSHDLRNPLVTVLGFLRLLQADVDTLTDNQRMAVERIGVSAGYMEGLIDDLLQLSRVGRTDSEPMPVPVAEVAHDIAVDVRARDEQVLVTIDTDAVVHMNPLRTKQLLTNLIDNAARHGGRRPLEVTVTSAPADPGWVHILVADDGVGIPVADRERVFQVFQRLHHFDASSEGSGIGLTMCRRIVEDVGGTITIVDAERGTTFRLTLPSAPAEPAQSLTGDLLSSQGT